MKQQKQDWEHLIHCGQQEYPIIQQKSACWLHLLLQLQHDQKQPPRVSTLQVNSRCSSSSPITSGSWATSTDACTLSRPTDQLIRNRPRVKPFQTYVLVKFCESMWKRCKKKKTWLILPAQWLKRYSNDSSCWADLPPSIMVTHHHKVWRVKTIGLIGLFNLFNPFGLFGLFWHFRYLASLLSPRSSLCWPQQQRWTIGYGQLHLQLANSTTTFLAARIHSSPCQLSTRKRGFAWPSCSWNSLEEMFFKSWHAKNCPSCPFRS